MKFIVVEYVIQHIKKCILIGLQCKTVTIRSKYHRLLASHLRTHHNSAPNTILARVIAAVGQHFVRSLDFVLPQLFAHKRSSITIQLGLGKFGAHTYLPQSRGIRPLCVRDVAQHGRTQTRQIVFGQEAVLFEPMRLLGGTGCIRFGQVENPCVMVQHVLYGVKTLSQFTSFASDFITICRIILKCTRFTEKRRANSSNTTNMSTHLMLFAMSVLFDEYPL